MFRKPTSVLLALIMSHAFLSLLSPSKSAKLMVARAFTTNSARPLLSARTCRLPGAPTFATTISPAVSRLYSSTSPVQADVEEDLDAALDDILGEALSEAGDEPKAKAAKKVMPVSNAMFRRTNRIDECYPRLIFSR
jgi:hypothetical protein